MVDLACSGALLARLMLDPLQAVTFVTQEPKHYDFLSTHDFNSIGTQDLRF